MTQRHSRASQPLGLPDHQPELLSKPLLEHIVELRRRLLWIFASLGLAFVLTYWQSAEIFQLLAYPLRKAAGHDIQMFGLSPQEIFFTYLKISFWAALFLAFPIIAGQLWMFIAPGLYRHERRVFLSFLVASPVLFVLGAALAYFLVLPIVLSFFLSFEVQTQPGVVGIQNIARITDYISLILPFVFSFGLSFQLPVLLVLLGRVGVLTAQALSEKRRLVIVLIFVAAAVLTPSTDVISQVCLAAPLLALYEISIWIMKREERRRASGFTSLNLL